MRVHSWLNCLFQRPAKCVHPQSDIILPINSALYGQFALRLDFHVIYSDRERVIHPSSFRQVFSSAEERRNTVVYAADPVSYPVIGSIAMCASWSGLPGFRLRETLDSNS